MNDMNLYISYPYSLIAGILIWLVILAFFFKRLWDDTKL